MFMVNSRNRRVILISRRSVSLRKSVATYQQMGDKAINSLSGVHQNTAGPLADEVAICSLKGVLWH